MPPAMVKISMALIGLFLNLLLTQLTMVNADQSQLQQRKLLDEPTPPTGEIKCGGCSSCSNPCAQSPPPPPPIVYPSPPPPSPPKKPPTVYCPPPPAPYIYITAPPGELYPVDPDYYGSAGRVTARLVAFSLLLVAGFW